MESWLAQYCINVSDLDRTVSFYEALGLECTSRTDIQVAKEAILENPNKGGKVQLAGADWRTTARSTWAACSGSCT